MARLRETAAQSLKSLPRAKKKEPTISFNYLTPTSFGILSAFARLLLVTPTLSGLNKFRQPIMVTEKYYFVCVFCLYKVAATRFSNYCIDSFLTCFCYTEDLYVSRV